METEETIKQSLKQFIREDFLPRGKSLDDDDALFDSGIIDSLGMIKLTAFMENKFDITVNPTEIRMESFNTINKIAGFVLRKLEKND